MALIPFMLLDFHWFGPGWYRDFKRARAQRERAERARRKRQSASGRPASAASHDLGRELAGPSSQLGARREAGVLVDGGIHPEVAIGLRLAREDPDSLLGAAVDDPDAVRGLIGGDPPQFIDGSAGMLAISAYAPPIRCRTTGHRSPSMKGSSGAAGAVSQAFSDSSASSWPEPQPA